MAWVNPKLTRLTAVYKLYDAYGRLIYVGISTDPEARFKQHDQDKWWWPLVYRREVEWTVGFRIAECIEKHLIKTHQPAHNVRGTARQNEWMRPKAAAARRALYKKYEDNPATSRFAWRYVAEEKKAAWLKKREAAENEASRLVVVTASDLRQRVYHYMRMVDDQDKRLIVTRRGVTVGVILPIDEYEAMCLAMGEPFDRDAAYQVELPAS